MGYTFRRVTGKVRPKAGDKALLLMERLIEALGADLASGVLPKLMVFGDETGRLLTAPSVYTWAEKGAREVSFLSSYFLLTSNYPPPPLGALALDG